MTEATITTGAAAVAADRAERLARAERRRAARVAARLDRAASPEQVAADLAALLRRQASSVTDQQDAADIAQDAMARILGADPASPVGRILSDWTDQRGRAVAMARALVRTLASNERRARTIEESDPVVAAIDADGPAEWIDRDHAGRRIRDAEVFAAAIGGPAVPRRTYADAEDADEQTEARVATVRRARRPWATPREQTTERSVRLVRERSLEDLLASSRRPWGARPGRDQVDAAGIHGGWGPRDEADRLAHRIMAEHLWDGPHPAPTSSHERTIVRALAVRHRTLGDLLAEHLHRTTPRVQASDRSARWHDAQGPRAIRALGDDNPDVGFPLRTQEYTRLDWGAALRTLGLPATAGQRRALQRLARRHAEEAAAAPQQALVGTPDAWSAIMKRQQQQQQQR